MLDSTSHASGNPLTALKAAFGAHYETFDGALKDDKTTLEALRGGDKSFYLKLLGECGVPARACPSLADALLKYFDEQPPPALADDAPPPTKKLRAEKEQLPWDKDLYASVKKATVCLLKDDVACTEAAAQTDGSEENPQIRKDVSFLKTYGGVPWFGASEDDVLPADELLIREWHQNLWGMQKDRLSVGGGAIVIGTPGIGKTMALNYLLFMYLTDTTVVGNRKRYVALILPNAGMYYIFDTKDEVAFGLPLDPTTKVWTMLFPFSADLFVLHDLGNYPPMTPPKLPTIVTTSPKSSNYNEFSKASCRLFFAPPLDNVEMTALSKKVQPSFSYTAVWPGGVCKSWQDAAYYYGNVPRSVFSRFSDADKMRKQLSRLTLAQLAVDGGPTTDANDLLVELIPTSPDYTISKYRYRRGYVTEEIAFKQLAAKLHEWATIVQFTTDGHMFEAILHRFLAKFPEKLRLDYMWSLQPPPSSCVRLSAKAALRSYWPTAISWRAVPFSPGQRTSLTHGTYYYPTKPNFTVVDSFLFLRPREAKKKIVLVCFQITLQNSHEANGRTLQRFVADFASLFELDNGKLAIRPTKSKISLDVQAATTKSPCYDLELHLIYLTPQESTFTYQTLQDGSTEDHLLWSHVNQYSCSSKSLCSK